MVAGGLLDPLSPVELPAVEVEPGVEVAEVELVPVEVELVPGIALLPLTVVGGLAVLAALATIGEALKLLEPPQPTIGSIRARKPYEKKP